MSAMRLCLVAIFLALCGCVTGYTLVAPGPARVGSLEVTPDSAWNRQPSMAARYAGSNGEVWTRDGMLLDRLILIGGVRDGDPLFVTERRDAAMPEFRAGMLPNEIEELTEASIAKMFGEGAAAVSTSGLRPHRFGVERGALFDLEIAVSDGPDYRGLAGAFVSGNELYLLLYIGAEPYYFDKHLPAAQALITGARLAAPD